ncbi:hypothetical protein [Streptomyces sp. NPDC001843]|uniref:hypothetical protein n=1 Tax=Streptomyces sp. NPDC001843 TaxID=3364617 RepID=UPI0036AC5F28
MGRATTTHRIVEYWTDKGTHVIFPVERNEEVDRMSDEQLISRFGDPEDGVVTRVVR